MQIKYKALYPNSRQHIVALPPLSDGQIKTNKLLHKLAVNTGSNFVTTKPMRDETTGALLTHLMENPVDYRNGKKFHYNDEGIKLLAREIKKSIFSESNIGGECMKLLKEMRDKVQSLNPPSRD